MDIKALHGDSDIAQARLSYGDIDPGLYVKDEEKRSLLLLDSSSSSSWTRANYEQDDDSEQQQQRRLTSYAVGMLWRLTTIFALGFALSYLIVVSLQPRATCVCPSDKSRTRHGSSTATMTAIDSGSTGAYMSLGKLHFGNWLAAPCKAYCLRQQLGEGGPKALGQYEQASAAAIHADQRESHNKGQTAEEEEKAASTSVRPQLVTADSAAPAESQEQHGDAQPVKITAVAIPWRPCRHHLNLIGHLLRGKGKHVKRDGT